MKKSLLIASQPHNGQKNHGGVYTGSLRVAAAAAAVAIGLIALTSAAQNATPNTTPAPAKEKIGGGYVIHQSADLGGHIADYSGSTSMWDTLVNLQSGPRILGFSLNMRSVDQHKTPLFDTLMTANYGYGGDPINTTVLRMSKGRIYDFTGSFRRDRQYFDYDLLANPLIPPNAVPYAPILTSPHLFNTVRRMADGDVTIMPLSRISFRIGYSQNIAEGPSFSSMHVGADALLTQMWRNSTSSYRAGIDFKLTPQTVLSYDQFYTYYKGDTSWQLTGLNYQLANGTPVSLGIDIFTTAANTCLLPGTTNTIKPACNGYLNYSRSLPTRTSFPTEQFRFVSLIPNHLSMNGRFVYSGATGSADHYSELFNGLATRTAQRGTVDVGNLPNGRLADTKRVNVNADGGVTWILTPTISISDVFNFWAFRIPGNNDYTETSVFGATLARTPNVFTPTTCPPPYTAATCPQHTNSSGPDVLSQQNNYFLGQNLKGNTVTASWDPMQKLKMSLGYRYVSKTITTTSSTSNQEVYTPTRALRGDCATGPVNADGTCNATTSGGGADVIPIHEQWGLFGFFFQPTNTFRLNTNVEAMYADNSYTRISPRQIQHYRVRGIYKPKQWMNFSGALNIFESRNNITDVNYLQHARDYSFGASITPGERWGVDLAYSYQDVFSRIDECYLYTDAVYPSPLTKVPCTFAGTPYLLSNGQYNAPTQFGQIGIMLAPIKRLQTRFGYQMSAVNGNETTVNPRQVPGSLQSQYQQPFANVSFLLAPQWTWKANWNYYSYGEGSPIGPTLPRSFRGNLYTLGVRYAF